MLTPGAENSVQRMADVTNTAQIVELWKSSKRSPETRRCYETDIRYFIAFVLGISPKLVQLNDLDLRTVTMNDVLAFADYLETKEYEVSTRARKLAAIKSLLRFALKVEWTKFNVAAEVPLPEPKDKLAERLLSELEVMTMIALTPKGRDRLVIQLLYYTGARVSEIAVLTWRSVQPGRDGNGQVTLYGKGQKTRTVVIPKSIYQELLGQRTNNSPDAPVFGSRQGGAVGERRIRKIVAESGKRAGISGNVSPHWLRHSHATHSLDRGAPVQLLQATLGHSSLNQTSRYTHARPNDSTGLYLPK
ncbi:tyrosine-type recombinase/integrase [Nostoc sp. UCD121]|uniref:tyrosine-type recombinase/integrase n=1 Tax=unclassified Nostoc TaxID=2593658 RepID=UPI00162A49BA|nr:MULTISPECIES: tyrosine-type recombinase/integrase [unclassified Nostoc]MBC1225213.1 tyrosine-type recombinase/integrase [Nostoc sp. UCD120]MBC1280745.1 tyrosine-type recombinase/integrase [Nostoc sp. UCD121]MBC1298649.1 tyrosine-type recombinase/integrase [Nostoc sp. UCD122]